MYQPQSRVPVTFQVDADQPVEENLGTLMKTMIGDNFHADHRMSNQVSPERSVTGPPFHHPQLRTPFGYGSEDDFQNTLIGMLLKMILKAT